MTTQRQTTLTKDLPNKKLNVVREFDASVDQVWKAWTERELLDQWWAPRPWRAETKSMDFREGGFWLYAMVGPEGEKHWARADYETIVPVDYFTLRDSFCDENGTKSFDIPSMYWKNEFKETPAGTRVEVAIEFRSEDDLETILKMGFQEGFTAAHSNLDELLAKK